MVKIWRPLADPTEVREGAPDLDVGVGQLPELGLEGLRVSVRVEVAVLLPPLPPAACQSVDDLPDEIRLDAAARRVAIERSGQATWQEAVEAFELDYLTTLFRRTAGNVSEAARLAGVSRGHLHRRIKQLDLDPASFRT